MKITRRQLKSIIIESILSEKLLIEGYDSMSNALTGVHGLFDLSDKNSEAVLVHIGGTDYGKGKTVGPGAGNRPAMFIMETIAAATNKDLSKQDYYLWKGLDDFWDNGAVGKIPATGRRSDPYLYMPSSIGSDGLVDKVKVIGGPVPSAIGREISARSLNSKQTPAAPWTTKSEFRNIPDGWRGWYAAGIYMIQDLVTESWNKIKETASSVKEAVVNAASSLWGWSTETVESLIAQTGIDLS